MFLGRIRTILLVALVFQLAAKPLVSAAEKAEKGKAGETAELRREIAALREENRRLRQLLIEKVDERFVEPNPRAKDGIIPEPEEIAEATAKKTAKAVKSAKYWLSSGGKRHNNKCRYFNGAGRACTKDDGVACKICGG